MAAEEDKGLNSHSLAFLCGPLRPLRLCGKAVLPPRERLLRAESSPPPQAWIIFMFCVGVGAGQPASWDTRTIASLVSKYTCQ
jgi:hypothetical protein